MDVKERSGDSHMTNYYNNIQIIIDDRLPVDGFGHLLCSYSNLRDEFWVSLLEKAYMKVSQIM